MSSPRVVSCWLLIVCAALLLPGASFAQSSFATLTGTVTDASGAVVPGATVIIQDASTKVSRQVKTNSSGYFSASNLPAGTYNVMSEASGFERWRATGIVLQGSDNKTINIPMKKTPEDYPPELREAVWLAGEAMYYAAAHLPDFARANEYSRRLTVHYDQIANIHYFLGTLKKFQSDYAGAAQEYQRELQISPDNAAAIIELARLASDDNRIEEAAKLAKRATELDSNNPEAHSLYGSILLKSGTLEESVREFEAAKKLAPDSASVRFQLASAYRRLHRTVDAERETKAFNLLKDKAQVIASAEEKLKGHPELLK